MKELWKRFRNWRNRLERVPGQWNDEVAGLRGAYANQEALQAILDPPSTETVSSVAGTANLEAKRVFEFLGASLQESAALLTSNWLSRHWADLLVIGGLLLLVMLPNIGVRSDAVQKARSAAASASKAREAHVIARHDLLPYAALDAMDLEAKNTKSPEDEQKLLASLTGRYPLKLIKADQPVSSELLSKKQIALTGNSIFRILLKAKPALEDRTLPENAKLLFSHHGTPPADEIVPIVLLNLDADGVTATIAVPEERLGELVKWIGNSDPYVSFPVR